MSDKKKKKNTPEWASPREDYIGETLAFDCGALPAGLHGEALARRLAAETRPLLSPRRNQILLLGLGGFSGADIAVLLRSARKAGFDKVKIELNLAEHSDPALYKKISAKLADELFAVMPPSGGGRGGSGESKNMLAPLEHIARSTGGKAGSLKVIAGVSGSPAGARNVLRTVAAAGVEHIILNAEPGIAAGAVAKLAGVCARFADENDAVIELRAGGETRAFRGPASRAREAESLFIEVPYYVISGRPVPLGAVFQLDFRCNQRCVFCTSDRSLPPLAPKVKKEILTRALERKPPRAVFTGGEPTVDKSLFDYMKMSKAAGVLEVAVYTNGMAFSTEEYTRRAMAAGLDLALVSLHSSRAPVSDRITNCKGGFAKTVLGIENLLSARVFTVINYVVNGMNYKETPEFVRFAAARFPGAVLNFSYVAPIMDETAAPEIIPRFTDAVPFLIDAMDECDALGVNATGLEPHWGVTPCALGEHRGRHFPVLLPLSEPYSGFVKADVCARCALDAACPGVRRNYAKLYGTGELKAV